MTAVSKLSERCALVEIDRTLEPLSLSEFQQRLCDLLGFAKGDNITKIQLVCHVGQLPTVLYERFMPETAAGHLVKAVERGELGFARIRVLSTETKTESTK